jgi:hypothetical protein
VTDAGGLDLDQHFARLGAFKIELDDLQGLLGEALSSLVKLRTRPS